MRMTWQKDWQKLDYVLIVNSNLNIILCSIGFDSRQVHSKNPIFIGFLGRLGVAYCCIGESILEKSVNPS